ncbi:hypothetical protein T439DRAFT_323851 [Meredithblackwellia eburnea MCA 4105]
MSRELPPEVLLHVLSCLPAEEDSLSSVHVLLAFGSTCRAWFDLGRTASLWTPHAVARWKRGPPPSPGTDSYLYYRRRAFLDQRTTRQIHSLARSTHARLKIVEDIRSSGEEVLDVLNRLRNTQEDDEPEYWLSLRHWAASAWEAILRDGALRTWRRISDEEDAHGEPESNFEDGALAFVAFRGADPEQVRLRFQKMMGTVTKLCKNSLKSPSSSLAHMVGQVIECMKAQGLKPVDGHGEDFHHPQNNFLSDVWDDADQHSMFDNGRGTLPMSLVVIFCSLIRRLPHSFNITARPVGFPGIVLALVSPREGSTEALFINVFDSGRILSKSDLDRMVSHMGVQMVPEYLQQASAKDMCHRIARNILHSVRTRAQDGTQSALYAAATAFFVFAGGHVYANWLVALIQSPDFSLDVALLESEEFRLHLVSDARRKEVAELCESIRTEDKEMPESSLRSAEIVWRTGHVFIHRLFGYVAVIRGWDYKCEASENWIQQMNVDSLPRGRNQPFYHVLCSDGSKLYVASENVTVVPVPENRYREFQRLPSIGLYFRTKGEVEGRPGFIKSDSLAAEYPED